MNSGYRLSLDIPSLQIVKLPTKTGLIPFKNVRSKSISSLKYSMI